MVEEDIQLMDDEHLLMRLKPYFLSFYDFYLIFAWIIILSGVFFVFDRHLVSLFGDPLGFFVGFAYEASSSNGNVLIEGLGAVNHAMGAINTLISPINNFLIMYSAIGLWL